MITKIALNRLTRSLLTLLPAVLCVFAPALAHADSTVGGVMAQAQDQFKELAVPFGVGCYIAGVILGIQTILLLHRYSQKPGDPPLYGILYRATGSSMFLSLPALAAYLRQTVFNEQTATFTSKWSAEAAGDGEGLDFALVNMVNDVKGALVYIVATIGFLSGLFMIASALRGLSDMHNRQSQLTARHIIVRFGVGTALISMVSTVNTLLNTLFGNTTSDATATLAYDASVLDADSAAHVAAVMDAIFVWMALIGMISILRGMWVLKESIEGQKGLTAPLTHLIAGACLMNCGPFVAMCEATLGIKPGA